MRDPLLIAGGGIGGLAAALALAEIGLPSRVFERRSDPKEEGAGIQLGPNGTRILRRLGVARLLEPKVAKPEALRVMSARDGREITRLPLGRWIETRHGSPYWTAHRHDLHASLLERARQSALIEISYGTSVVSAADGGEVVTAFLDTGASASGPVLVAADGIRSRFRSAVMGADDPVFTGKIAIRAVIPTDDVDAAYRENVHIWLAPGAHVVHYPVRGESELALVIIIDGEDESETWGEPLAPEDVAKKTARLPLSDVLRAVLARPHAWRLWSLQGLRRPVPFAKGRIALLGDSAHPVLPFLAQGAVLALEDAVTLVDALRSASTPDAALGTYASLREPRAARVVRASAMNGRIYHLEGPAAVARNFVMRHAPPSRVMAGLDWLYGFRTL